jgi:steroid delta-isomerase-like uncharacterized protein
MTTAQAQAQNLIRRYYSTFNSGDRGALLAMFSDEVVHEINQGVREEGRLAFEAFLRRMDRCYSEQVEDLVVMAREDGSGGAAEFFIRGAYIDSDDGLPPATGQSYRLRVGAFFDLQAGLVSRVTNYYNLQDWIAQIEG